jgi:acyl dehydratase
VASDVGSEKVKAMKVTKTLPPTRGFAEVNVGDELPELVIPLTPTVIVSTAIASRDYQDVHHDRDLAHEKGSKDIFMNILSTNGFVGRYVTDWAGPNAVLGSVKIRLGVPNYPYDEMRMSGKVESKEWIDGEGRVEIAIRGANQLGDHVKGTVELVLPAEGGA